MNVIVGVKDGKDVNEVAAALEKVGMTVTNVLPLSLVIAGSTTGSLDDLQKVDGVMYVEKELTAHTQSGG